jgi:GNAT superfamily N-acetyltransferase
MGEVEIREVGTAAERLRFIKMPWKLYEGDSHWIPPIISDMKKFLDPKRGVFYEHGEARLFMAFRGGSPVGRISAHVNHLHDQRFADGKGFFGFFECENNQETADALLAAAEEELRRRGKTTCEGALSFGIYDEVGILVEGFDTDPFVLNVHNPPYYRELLERAGYEKSVDWYAFHGYVKSYEDLDPKLHRLKERVLERSGVSFRTVDLKQLDREARIVLDIFHSAWDDNWGHVPFTKSEFERLVEALRMIVAPGLSLVAEKEGRPVGMALTLYDANEAVKRINGRLFPIGFLKLLLGIKKSRRFRQFAMGVLEEFRGRGLEIAMFMTVAEEAYKMGFREGEMSLIVETNVPMMKTLTHLPVRPYKTYRIFRKEIG